MDKTKDTRTEVASEDFEQIFVKETGLTVTSKTSEEIKKRDASSVQTVTDDIKAHKQLKTGICEISDQVILPSIEQSSMNLELQANAKTSQIELGNKLLTDIKPEYSIIEESHSQYKGDQVFEYSGDTKISTLRQNTQSSMNSSLDENTPDEVPESEGSIGKIALPIDDTLVDPEPSSSQENYPQDSFENQSRLIGQTVKEMEKLSICFACDRQIAEHFKCCKCKYKRNIQDSLLWHICREHLSEPYFCTICKIRFSKENSHESKHPCNACTEIFQCVTQLEVHFASHEKRHKEICRICQTEIHKHCIKLEDGVSYRCCVCQANREFEKKRVFLGHLYTHSDLKIFKCDQCGDRFKEKSEVRGHSKIHPKCGICGQRFVDRNSVDAHILEKHR